MKDPNFDKFYSEIEPEAAYLWGTHGSTLSKEKRSAKVIKLEAQILMLNVLSEGVNFLADVSGSERLHERGRKLVLKVWDRFLGIAQTKVDPTTMAQSLGHPARQAEFVSYAESLSLPYIANVIRAATQNQPPHPSAQPS